LSLPTCQLATACSGFFAKCSALEAVAAGAVLAALAPNLRTAACTASTKAFVILDGRMLPIDRIAADRPFHSGKHKTHGMNVQIIADPAGRLVCASPALPAAVHDIRVARTHGIIDALEEAGVECWADKGYRGVRRHHTAALLGSLGDAFRRFSMSTARMRGSVRSSSRPWPPSRPGGSCAKLRCSTTRITSLVQAVLTLHLTCSS
jgi:hypothetical protein